MNTLRIRVYWEDTDGGGVVYHANYLKFAERARTETLRKAGIEQTTLMKELGIGFVARQCEVEFLKPARLDDLLTIETRLIDSGAASLTFAQTIFRGNERLVELKVKIGVINASFKPTRLPATVRAALIKSCGSASDAQDCSRK